MFWSQIDDVVFCITDLDYCSYTCAWCCSDNRGKGIWNDGEIIWNDCRSVWRVDQIVSWSFCRKDKAVCIDGSWRLCILYSCHIKREVRACSAAWGASVTYGYSLNTSVWIGRGSTWIACYCHCWIWISSLLRECNTNSSRSRNICCYSKCKEIRSRLSHFVRIPTLIFSNIDIW